MPLPNFSDEDLEMVNNKMIAEKVIEQKLVKKVWAAGGYMSKTRVSRDGRYAG